MELLRGATLATAHTLGLADTSDLGPTAGNGFFKRWPDDLATLQANAITDVRLSLDWARLQPKPGVIDDGWSDQYQQIVEAAEAIGLRVWATLFDGAVPRWFDNEGGAGDASALATWWPRYVDRVAERFGDVVDGWVPFAVIPQHALDAPWRDTWRILGAGGPQVVASISAGDVDRAGRLAGQTDRVGVDVRSPFAADHTPTERELSDLAERWGEAIAAAALAAATPVEASISPDHDDPEVSGRLVGALLAALSAARHDGAEVAACFVDPGIAGPDHASGLFDKDRAPRPALAALLDRSLDD